MASSKKTSKLALNLWQAADKPERADFVADNEILEEKLTAHFNDSEQHLTAVEKARATRPFQIFLYTGDGAETRKYTLSFNPRFVLVMAKDRLPMFTKDSITYLFSAVQMGSMKTPGLDCSARTLLLSQKIVSETDKEKNQYQVRLNQYNTEYVGIAFQ